MLKDSLRAWRLIAMMATGLQRDIYSASGKALTLRYGVGNSHALSMEITKTRMIALGYYPTIAHNHRTDKRIRVYKALTTLRQSGCTPQVTYIITGNHIAKIRIKSQTDKTI
jgi:hypothetical protein